MGSSWICAGLELRYGIRSVTSGDEMAAILDDHDLTTYEPAVPEYRRAGQRTDGKLQVEVDLDDTVNLTDDAIALTRFPSSGTNE